MQVGRTGIILSPEFGGEENVGYSVVWHDCDDDDDGDDE